MEIEGKIIVVLPEQSGVSARTGSAWKSQEFVIETHEQYPRKCCFRVFGADRLATMNIQSGEELRVSVDIDAHEYSSGCRTGSAAFCNRCIPARTKCRRGIGCSGFGGEQCGRPAVLKIALLSIYKIPQPWTLFLRCGILYLIISSAAILCCILLTHDRCNVT